MKKNNKKGFTLAELLIVVAIVAVLVAIAVPVFTAQLDRARCATATANARSIYAEYVAECMAPKGGGEAVDPTSAELKTSLADLGVSGAKATVEAGKVTVDYNGKVKMSFAIDDDVK